MPLAAGDDGTACGCGQTNPVRGGTRWTRWICGNAAPAGPGPRPRPGAPLDERSRGRALLAQAVAPRQNRVLPAPTAPQRAHHAVSGRAGRRLDELLGALP